MALLVVLVAVAVLLAEHLAQAVQERPGQGFAGGGHWWCP
jgi:hypothetical protein